MAVRLQSSIPRRFNQFVSMSVNMLMVVLVSPVPVRFAPGNGRRYRDCSQYFVTRIASPSGSLDVLLKLLPSWDKALIVFFEIIGADVVIRPNCLV